MKLDIKTMEDKKMSTEKGDYTERLRPSNKAYTTGTIYELASGNDNKDGVYIEWLGVGRIVVRKDGIDYKQTFEEFINNCNKI